MNRPLFTLLPAFLLAALVGCTSSEKNPGFSIHSPPDDFNADVTRECGDKYDEWVTLSNTPIRPTLGTSKIKHILSAIHNIGLTHVEGCPDIGVSRDLEKAFIYLQLANDFEYIPTRYVLGKALIRGDIIERDLDLGVDYLQQVIFCDRSFNRTYLKQAEAFLTEAKQAFPADASQFDKNCNQIQGAYFRGPTPEFDALAFKTDWEGRSATLDENWDWLGAGFRGTATFIEEALPVALAGAAIYYTAKMSQEYRSIPQYSVPHLATSSRTGAIAPSSSNHNTQSGASGRTGSQIFTSDDECRSDFDCGLGRVCAKPQGSFSFTGLCGTLVNESGAPTYTVPISSAQPHEISACTFDTSCPVGYRCKKVGHAMTGVCVR